jgi:uncharacterized membrane protein
MGEPHAEKAARRGIFRRPPISRSPVVNVMLLVLAVLVIGTIVGLIILWPSGKLKRPASLQTLSTQGARVTRADKGPCSLNRASTCQSVTVKLTSGAHKGETTTFEVTPIPGLGDLEDGDLIRVIRNPPPPAGATVRLPPYSFSDFDRRLPMIGLGIMFVVLLLATGRLHGLRALIGLGASLLVVLKFVIPSILLGHSAVGVALAGALAVMLVTIPLSYGLGAKAIAAWLGTAASLLLAVGLAWGFTQLAHLTGAASEEATLLSATESKISLQGLLLAGMVIGALGVLVDLTVSQASTVIALRRVNPALGFGQLFRGAVDVGHDHIAATVNTLVFAYAGASLPVLLIFSIGGTNFTDAVNSEAVSEEVIAALVGSIGLIASMPITTGLAALLALRMSDRELSAQAHAHAH